MGWSWQARATVAGLAAVAWMGATGAGVTGAAAAGKAPCKAQRFAGQAYVVCSIDAGAAEISVRWRGADGKPLGSLGAVERAARKAGRRLMLAMNGGMYHEDLSPVGYHVENRKKINGANTRRGPGNFHMLPNGIFFVEKGRAGVMETRAFLKRNRRPDHATQSGPMLVIDGKLHPTFRADSESRFIRNGVGVSRDGKVVHFVISDEPVTFHAFASLFQRHLKVANALYLDGNVSQLVSASLSRRGFRPVGPVIVALEK
ncbi:MAG: hypothetical protein RLZ98_743 [Pseudomonadota bacterium]|jgi:prepilin-type processing-associated H-X9-DG protein